MTRLRLRELVTLSVLLALLPFVASPVSAATGVSTDLVINEFDADQSGTDSAEFVELYDGGSGDTDLSGLSIVLYNGSDNKSYRSYDLDGYSTNGSGYFVLCGDDANVANCDLDVSPSSSLIQNGADAAVLLVGDAVDYPNDSAQPGDADIVDAIVYDTNDWDDSGLLGLINPGQPQVNEDGGRNKDWQSSQRCSNGSGGQRNTSSYSSRTPTPGLANDCPAPPTDELIHDVQGAGWSSPIVGTEVTVQGIVTANFQSTGLGGFYLQEEDSDADGDADTSEGIYVFDDARAVSVGDKVEVTGTVIEYFGHTQLANISSVVVTGSDSAPTPAALVFPIASFSELESVEGMGVIIAQEMTIAEYYNFGRYGEIALTVGRLDQPTAVYAPGTPESFAEADLNARSRIALDDGQGAQNPDPARHPNGAEFDLTNRFRGGDLLSDVVGVMDYSFGAFKIQPTAGATHTAFDRPAAPEDVGGDITVASFNVLNYFSTLDGSGPICGPDTNQFCRGADNAGEFTRQREKIISAISQIDADIVGVIEIENHATDAALIDLVDGLNAAMDAGTYDYVPAGVTGTDVIKVAFIYKPSTVSLTGAAAILDTPEFIDPNNTGRNKNRAALAQTFTENATGESFTAVVNHFKSKGSPCGSGDDSPQTANCNLTRTLAAQELTRWLAGDPTGSLDPDILVIGDLNSYDKEDPINAMLAGADQTNSTGDDFYDLVAEYQGEDAYSYLFDGQWAYLDYAMSNVALHDQVTGTTVWHINADEPSILDYDTSYKKAAQDALYEPNAYRSSDHDPVIVGLDLQTDLQGKKEAVIDSLTPVSSGDSKVDEKISDAIESIEESLNSDWWSGDSSLSNKKVFDKERKAVESLEHAVRKADAPTAFIAQNAIYSLVAIDRQLAGIEIASAIAGGGDAGDIADALEAIAAGDTLAANGHAKGAMTEYKSAWEYANGA